MAGSATSSTATKAVLPDRAANCSQCGSPLDPGDRFCQACGHENQPAAAEIAPQSASPQQKFMRCNTCGAEVAIDPNRRSYTCPFCDSNYVIEFSPESGRPAPEFVIGFAVAPAQAEQSFLDWLGRGGLFRPGDLRHSSVADKLQGVYLPFWSFSMLAHSAWRASIGEHWYRTETYTTTENGKTVTKTRTVTETEWWPLAGRHHNYYSGYLISGSRGLSQTDAERVKPFRLEALKRYAPQYLAGWSSEECSVAREDALNTCNAEFQRREQSAVESFLPGDTHSDVQVSTSFDQVNSDLILLPIYLLSYRYRGKLYRFLLNGQTGRYTGDKPWSWRRIAAAILLILLVIALIAVFANLFH
jgi:hypothetical protein